MSSPPPSPPMTHKGFSKTAKIVIAIIVIASIALASTAAVLLSRPSQNSNNPQNNTTPDISGVQILRNNSYAQMSEDGFATQTPYRFHIYITLQIKNPTQYDVTLRIYGEVNITGSDTSGVVSGNHVLDNTVDFSVAKYSQADYQIPLYTSSWWYSDSNAVSATINDYHISELWRGTGNPP